MKGNLKIPQDRKANVKWVISRFSFFNRAGNRVMRSLGNRWSQKMNLPLSPEVNLIFIRQHCNQTGSQRGDFPLLLVCPGTSSMLKNGSTHVNWASNVQHGRRELYKISHSLRAKTPPFRPNASIDDAFPARTSPPSTHTPREGIRCS